MSKPSTLENFWNRPSVDDGLEIVLDPLRHSKPGEPKRKQAVSICHGVWLRPFYTRRGRGASARGCAHRALQ